MQTLEDKIDQLLSLVSPKPKAKDENEKEIIERLKAKLNSNKLKRLAKG